MITIKHTQRKIKFDTEQFKRDIQTVLDALDYSDFDINFWLTTNTIVHRFNREFRDKDKPTDILSFPYYPELKAGKRIIAREEEDKNLGDIIISLEYVLKDASRWEKTFEERMKILLVHGICHLLGYDHIEDTDYKVMHKKELSLLKLLSV